MFSRSRPIIRIVQPRGLAAWAARRLAAMAQKWGQRWRQRRDLDRLDDRLLKDIGLSRDRVKTEIRRMPWQG